MHSSPWAACPAHHHLGNRSDTQHRQPAVAWPCVIFLRASSDPRGIPMKFIHQREHLNEDDIVVIECSSTCNIRLMSDANFRSFKNGGRHTYHGGAFDKFPAKIVVPSTGFWNITLDTVTQRAISVTRKPNIKHSIKIVRRSGSRLQ